MSHLHSLCIRSVKSFLEKQMNNGVKSDFIDKIQCSLFLSQCCRAKQSIESIEDENGKNRARTK